MLSPLDCLPAKAGGAVNGCAYAPFILTVDWLGWVCYLPDKLEFILSYHVLPYNMLTNIFEDNVRDFQGYNIVNSEIQDTLKNSEDQARFGLLNNGITIVAKSITPVGDQIEI